eukprot:96162-Chlamydomonas_euryale.AAC.4
MWRDTAATFLGSNRHSVALTAAWAAWRAASSASLSPSATASAAGCGTMYPICMCMRARVHAQHPR